jgi:murein DD-endopeptidase MepM/ murein hydrolase activator NlpD
MMFTVGLSAEVVRPVRLEVSRSWLSLGTTLRLDLYTIHPIKDTTISFSGHNFVVFQIPKTPQARYHYVAYMGASRYTKSGNYPLKVKVVLSTGQSFSDTKMITVNHPQTKAGKVTLSNQKKDLSRDTKTLHKESTLIGRRFKTLTPVAYFKGTFKWPAKGRISSQFGKMRLYNSGISRLHAGTDIANEVGTPVWAPNHGRVILSQSLKVHGETVMIDHGFGVVTIYNHLNERFVSRGQLLSSGDLIGRMGKTGLVSGPHLHWGMSVQNVRVDPMLWVTSI